MRRDLPNRQVLTTRSVPELEATGPTSLVTKRSLRPVSLTGPVSLSGPAAGPPGPAAWVTLA